MEYLKQALKHSPIGTALVESDGKFRYANAALSAILGYSHGELIDISWQSITHPDDLEIDAKLVDEMIAGKRDAYQLKKRYIRKDGSICYAILSVSKIFKGNGDFDCFLSQINDNEDRELKAFHNEVLQAIAANQFILHYQSIVKLKTLETVGYEALIRWQHPIKGLIYPNDFIEKCEADKDIMLQLCQWVFCRACSDRHKLNGFVSVNVSPQSLMHLSFIGLAERCAVVADSPVIFFEVTERVLANLEGTEVLRGLERNGYGFFADDFGQANTGFVQVIQIIKAINRETTIKVKIDIWFTRHLNDSVTYASMKVLIKWLHELGVEVIAEGIETDTQLRQWLELGVDYGQGWLWEKPRAIE
jgi:PAS domain S-box-containing protein